MSLIYFLIILLFSWIFYTRHDCSELRTNMSRTPLQNRNPASLRMCAGTSADGPGSSRSTSCS